MVFRNVFLWFFIGFSGVTCFAPLKSAKADIEGLKPIPFGANQALSNARDNIKLNEIEPSIGQEDVNLDQVEDSLTIKRSTIKDGDIILLTVEGEPELTKNLPIDSQGNIDVPLIGQVKVLEQDIAFITETITNRLKDGYINDPVVAVSYKAAEPIYILGEVTNPGAYEFTSNLTPLKAAALAGGFSKKANQDYFELIENHNGGKDSDPSAIVKMIPYFKVLQPGDTIKVRKQAF
ncbi:MAG: polysaccharide biosynthesis/export family protein [Alphaproteobacteria bacterium]|nr:polysaccharide biosynthesis/export family protein [Alphaproteobacteria bacterium]